MTLPRLIRRPAAVATVLLCAALAVSTARLPVSAQDQPFAATVFAAIRVLETTYVDPVQPIPLLNAAIAALRDTSHLRAAQLADIPPGTAMDDAAVLFRSDLRRAGAATGDNLPDLAGLATQAMLDSLHDSHTYFISAQDEAEAKRELADRASYAGTARARGCRSQGRRPGCQALPGRDRGNPPQNPPALAVGRVR